MIYRYSWWHIGRHIGRLSIVPAILTSAGILFGVPLDAQEVRVDIDDEAGELGLGWSIGPLEFGDDGRRLPSVEWPTVSFVVPCSPAHHAGVQPQDAILKVDGQDAREGRLFPRAEPGTPYDLLLMRGKAEIETKLVIGPRRANPPDEVRDPPIVVPSEWGCPPGPVQWLGDSR